MALVESVDHMGGFAGITNYLVKRASLEKMLKIDYIHASVDEAVFFCRSALLGKTQLGFFSLIHGFKAVVVSLWSCFSLISVGKRQNIFSNRGEH